MDTFTCTQHGCEIEADAHPANCPVCNNPQNITGEDKPWSDYTKAELIEQCDDWGIDGYNSTSKKADLIALLEQAEANAD